MASAAASQLHSKADYTRRMACTDSTLDDMIDYASFDVAREHAGLKAALVSLRGMVGMDEIKESVAEQVQYFLSLSLSNKPPSPALTRATASARRSKKRRRAKHGWSRRKQRKPRGSSRSGGSSSAATLVRARIEDLTTALLDTIGNDDSDSDYEMDDEVSVTIRPPFAVAMNLHTLIIGGAGTGKTTLARILASIWGALGLIKRGHFVCVTRGDLIGKYQGHSTANIKNLMRKYQNGVVFIDEAYSLMQDDKDTFGSEVMSEIVEGMTNPTNNVTFIMAGYEKAVKRSILGHNEGLERRFGAIHTVPKPSVANLACILLGMLKQGRWKAPSVSTDALASVLHSNKASFLFGGGDMEVLCDLTKKAHIKRLWPAGLTRRINMDDVKAAVSMFKRSKDRTPNLPTFGLYS